MVTPVTVGFTQNDTGSVAAWEVEVCILSKR